MEGGTSGRGMLAQQPGMRQCPSCKGERGEWRVKTAGRERSWAVVLGAEEHRRGGTSVRVTARPVTFQPPLHSLTQALFCRQWWWGGNARPSFSYPIGQNFLLTRSLVASLTSDPRDSSWGPQAIALPRQSSPPLFWGCLSRVGVFSLGPLLIFPGKCCGSAWALGPWP